MGKRLHKQFERFHGEKVLITIRREPKSYVGVLEGEDPYFVFLRDVQVVTNGQSSKSPEVAISKHLVGEVRVLNDGRG